jgi:small subunit ribosomal protein S4
MSRQLVTHGHVIVNSKKMSIPSYQVQEGDVVTIDTTMQKNPDIIKSLEEEKEIIAYLEKKGAVGKLKRMPKPDDVHAPFNTRQIIEFYSR